MRLSVAEVRILHSKLRTSAVGTRTARERTHTARRRTRAARKCAKGIGRANLYYYLFGRYAYVAPRLDQFWVTPRTLVGRTYIKVHCELTGARQALSRRPIAD